VDFFILNGKCHPKVADEAKKAAFQTLIKLYLQQSFFVDILRSSSLFFMLILKKINNVPHKSINYAEIYLLVIIAFVRLKNCNL